MLFPVTFATPVQGFLGGVGIALSSSLLLFTNGRVFGISGFLHRSCNPRVSLFKGWKSTSEKLGDAIAVTGLVIGGIVIGALESKYAPNIPSPFEPLVGSEYFKVVAGGFLIGLGSKLQNGCTSGHMVCGLSRFSWRSFAATAIFFPVAALTAQVHRQSLQPIAGYDWSTGPLGPSLLGLQGTILSLSYGVLFLGALHHDRINAKILSTLKALIVFSSAFSFSFALRLSTLSSPIKVLSFLILPFPDIRLFDPTLFFLAISAIPVSAGFYRLGTWLRRRQSTKKIEDPCTPTKSETETESETTERSPLIQASLKKALQSHPVVPLLEKGGSWPSNATHLDWRLITGAVIFGVGWGLEGVCPGPGLLNLGRAIFVGLTENSSPELGRWSLWLLSAVVGGLAAPTA